MIEVLLTVVASVPAALAGYVAGRRVLSRPGRHEVGVSARRVCERAGRPVRARRRPAHAV